MSVLRTASHPLICPYTVSLSRTPTVAQTPPFWFQAHRYAQTAGLVFTSIAFAIAIAMTSQDSKPHFSNLHAKLGLAVTILGLLQPINAFIRPHPQPRTALRIVRAPVSRIGA
jgi:hypothetical protein